MGKSKPKDASKQADLPKYMCMNGSTQYELAQSIDEAMASADREVKADQEQEALLLWYEQILDGIHETFLLQKSVKSIPNNNVMVGVITELLPLCWAYYRSTMDHQLVEDAECSIDKAGFQLLMIKLLEHSFINALDILHARNLWRFDIQRNMQQAQGRMINGVKLYVES
jgi:hypothetical protein